MKRVYLEICNACNLDCPFCSNPKGQSYLSLEEINDYLDQIRPFCSYIYLHILGEPLMHPDFDMILHLLDEKQMYLQLVTNGTLLKDHPDIIDHPCLRKLSISLHSVNSISIGPDYFKTIDRLIEKDTETLIELRFFDRGNLNDQLKNYLADLKKRYEFMETSRSNSYRLKDHLYVLFEDLFRWPSINDPFISDEGTCHGGIDMIAINSSSEVTLCCLDPYAYNSIGNLKEKKLKEILESERYQLICRQIKEHKLSCELCQKCSYRLRF
ncbi:MAG: radical SAM protein [Erysipelotrichaceae bacterium]|nr:radical SAM protein [Erysipelotrichaceae bacterium]